MKKAMLLPIILIFFNACLQSGYGSDSLTAPVLALEAEQEPEHLEINWVWNDLSAGLRKAKEEDKLVLMDFWAGWCYWCVKMDEEMNSSAVVEMMKNYVPVKIDTDLPQNSGLLSTYRIIGTPAFVILDGDKRVLAQGLGYMPEKEFLSFLERALYREE